MPGLSEVASPWTFGWDALVACGTIGLAIATVILGLITRGVAKSTAEEVQSQSRPVLLATSLGRGSAILLSGEQLRLQIRNGGKGPAFEIKCRLEPGALAPEDWSSGILERDTSEILNFSAPGLGGRERFELRLDYKDLAARRHSSRIVIQLIAKTVGNELKREFAFLEVAIS